MTLVDNIGTSFEICEGIAKDIAAAKHKARPILSILRPKIAKLYFVVPINGSNYPEETLKTPYTMSAVHGLKAPHASLLIPEVFRESLHAFVDRGYHIHVVEPGICHHRFTREGIDATYFTYYVEILGDEPEEELR